MLHDKLDKPRPVTTLPGRRGFVARMSDALPPIGLYAAPLLVRQGRQAQKRLAHRLAREHDEVLTDEVLT